MIPCPLESRYGANLTVAIVSLVPFIILAPAGRPGLPRPDVEKWLSGEEPAVESPPVAAIWR